MKKTMPYPSVDTLPAAIVESEERLRLAAEAADLFAWELNLENNTLKWSQNAARVLNCDADKLTSDPAQRDFFINLEDRLEVLNAYENAKAAGSDKFDASFRGLEGDIDHAFWRVYGKIIYDDIGVATRVIAATQNITFQKNAEEELRLLAQRLATAEEAAGTLIYDWNLKTGVVWRSAGIEPVLGWTAQEMGTSMAKWAELLHPADAPRMEAMARSDFTLFKDHFVAEYRLRHKLGYYVWLLDSGRVYRDAQGNVFRVAGALVDISSRKRAEASSNRQAAMINLSFEPIFVWHPEHGIVEWNQGAQQLYGYTRDEAIGQSSDTLLQTIRPITQEKLLEILKTENSWQAELQRNAKGGRQLIVECRYQLIDVDGDILILETDHDISERKLAETYTARMAAVALASHDALFGITPQGYIETWNPAAQRVFGYSANEAIGQHVRILALSAMHEGQSKILRQVQNS
ncbi:MAG TPA: PAS domain S-box protein, partial [Aestuariivirga sp.]